MFWSVFAIVYGVFMAMFPRKTVDVFTRMSLSCYKNPDELEPKSWLLTTVRITGLLLALTGMITIRIQKGLDNRQKTTESNAGFHRKISSKLTR